MPRPLPERLPVGDPFTGAVMMAHSVPLLVQPPPDGSQIIHSGTMVVRYGARYLGKPHLSVVPGLIAIDYGEIVNGEAAWEFLIHRSNLYPRAEVFGYRNDGRDEMIVVKQLDLALPPQVLVYKDDEATTPIASPSALVAARPEGLPPRLLQYLTCYPSVEEWEADERP
jgi:hypothetical protein